MTLFSSVKPASPFLASSATRAASQVPHTPSGRRLAQRLLPVSLMLLLAACGGGGDGSPSADAGSNLSAATSDSASTEALTSTVSTTDPSLLTTEEPVSLEASVSGIETKAIASNDVCRAILQRNYSLQKGQEAALIPSRGQPGMRSAYLDPVYHTCISRVTNNDAGSGEAYRRNDYSRRQAFNANSSYMLIYSLNGYWYLYDANTLRMIRRLQGPAGAAEAHWHPTNPNLIWHLGKDGIGLQIYQTDVRTSTTRLVSDMSAQVKSRWPSAAVANTRAEGAPSADGRFWCFQAETSSRRILGVFTWDMVAQRIVGGTSLSERPDHVSMSPSGKYCVVSSDGSLGTRAYTRDFRSAHPATGRPWLQLQHKSEHSDIAFDRNRQDTYVSVNYAVGDIFMVNLNTGKRTSLFSAYPGRTVTAMHFSGKAYRKPGWVLVSTYAAAHADNRSANIRNTARQQWLHRKMFAVSLNANPTIRPIAHVDSNFVSSGNFFSYWTEPHATVNPDFTRMLFNSTWNSNNALDVETYLTAIPSGALDR